MENREIIKNNNIIKLNEIQIILISFFSYCGLIIYFISFLVFLFCLDRIAFIKSNHYSFILLSSITDLIQIFTDKNDLIKHIFIFTSYIIQFHLVITSFNKLLLGEYIFKTDKDFSIKKKSIIKFILFPLITFPYSSIFEHYSNIINFFQYIFIILSILILNDYIKININDLISYLRDNKKDNILIPNMEPEQLIKIYIIIDNLRLLLFFFSLTFYIIKFFDILLIKIYNIHFIAIIIIVTLKTVITFLFFICLVYITYLLNKNYESEEIIPNDEDENNENSKGLKKIQKIDENKKIDTEFDDIEVEINNKKNNYKSLEKSQNEDNII